MEPQWDVNMMSSFILPIQYHSQDLFSPKENVLWYSLTDLEFYSQNAELATGPKQLGPIVPSTEHGVVNCFIHIYVT